MKFAQALYSGARHVRCADTEYNLKEDELWELTGLTPEEFNSDRWEVRLEGKETDYWFDDLEEYERNKRGDQHE
jgi:hypothetical protein